MVAPERSLDEAEVSHDPIAMFHTWYDDAVAQGTPQPDAMVLATASRDGTPSARVVLLRGVDERGFRFFTNFASRKGVELDANPRAALVFHWPEALRQVRVTGVVDRVSDDESDAYWGNRPRASLISAWASRQSERVPSRAALEDAARASAARFAGEDVPRPGFWGGYRVVPRTIELWQHRDDRLHDRLLYRRSAGAGAWVVERLQP